MDYETELHCLIPMEDFKALVGVDDRDDALARFVLNAATKRIESYCERRLLAGTVQEYFPPQQENYYLLKEYPIRAISKLEVDGSLFSAERCHILPLVGSGENMPCDLVIKPEWKKRSKRALYIEYEAGYECGKVPADLASACLELAFWNMNRYRGRVIGTTRTVRGRGSEGEHFEMTMPQNVAALIEPYKRKMI